VVVRDVGEIGPDLAVARPDDAPPRADSVRLGDRGGPVERRAQLRGLLAEVRIEPQLLRHDEGSHEDDVSPAVGREAAGDVERMLGLVPPDERHDDAAVANGRGPAGEPVGAAAGGAEVRPPHRMTW
jgi:hypothetical protein